MENSNGENPADETAEPIKDIPETQGFRTVLVAIRGQNRSAHFLAGEHTLHQGDEVVVQTEKGKAIGVVTEPPVTLHCRRCADRVVLRKATPEETEKDRENRELERKALDFCSNLVREWDIPMHLVRVEFLLDRSKAIFYFTAEKRVDFRELVRMLAKEFGTRIEMRQIGIRDEARILGGLGPCGMPFCCSTFLKDFDAISVKMAKEQNVILNPAKISGGCGRLLCCLSFEYAQYRELLEGLPKTGKKITLGELTGKIRFFDMFTRKATIDMSDGTTISMDIDELKGKLK